MSSTAMVPPKRWERAAAGLRLRGRLFVAALAAALAAGLLAWLLLELFLLAGTREGFGHRCANTGRQARARLAELRDHARAARLATAVSYREARTNIGYYRSEYQLDLYDTAPYYPFAAAAETARAQGVELIVHYAPTDSRAVGWNEDLFTEKLPIADRESLRRLVAGGDTELVAVVGHRCYLFGGRIELPGEGWLATILPLNDVVLDEVAARAGAPVVLTAGETVAATSIFHGMPVIRIPNVTLWEGNYLARRMPPEIGDVISYQEVASRMVLRRSGQQPHLGDYFFRLTGDAREVAIRNQCRLSRLVPLVETWIPLPVDTWKKTSVRAILMDERGINRDHYTGEEDEAAERSRVSIEENIFSKMLIAFPRNQGGGIELYRRTFANWQTDYDTLLRRSLDWRPEQRLEPLNLFTADTLAVRNLFARLAFESESKRILLRALGSHLGPQGAPYSPRIFYSLGHNPYDDPSFRIYREDPARYESARRLFARPPADGDEIELDGVRYLVRTAEEPAPGVRLMVLNNYSEHQTALRAVYLAGFGGIGIILGAIVAVMMLVGTVLLRPFHRLTAALRAVTAGDLDARFTAAGRDEFVSIAAGFDRMVASIRDRHRLESSFRRYAPESVVRAAAETGSDAAAAGMMSECTILFADVRGFTVVSQRLAPDEIVRLLNLYFNIFIDEIHGSGGTIVKFIGDAVLAVWGTPLPAPDHAARAVATAVRIQATILELNREWLMAGEQVFYFGMGITTGTVLAARLGNEVRTDWSLIGDEVHLASKIAGQAWPYQVIVTEATSRGLDPETGIAIDDRLKITGLEPAPRLGAVRWYRGHTRPVMIDRDDGNWFCRDGGTITGPFTVETMIAQPGFGAETVVSTDRERWQPWRLAARPLQLWVVETADGEKGPWRWDEILAWPDLTDDTMVRVLGSPEPYPLHVYRD